MDEPPATIIPVAIANRFLIRARVREYLCRRRPENVKSISPLVRGLNGSADELCPVCSALRGLNECPSCGEPFTGALRVQPLHKLWLRLSLSWFLWLATCFGAGAWSAFSPVSICAEPVIAGMLLVSVAGMAGSLVSTFRADLKSTPLTTLAVILALFLQLNPLTPLGIFFYFVFAKGGF